MNEILVASKQSYVHSKQLSKEKTAQFAYNSKPQALTIMANVAQYAYIINYLLASLDTGNTRNTHSTICKSNIISYNKLIYYSYDLLLVMNI